LKEFDHLYIEMTKDDSWMVPFITQ